MIVSRSSERCSPCGSRPPFDVPRLARDLHAADLAEPADLLVATPAHTSHGAVDHVKQPGTTVVNLAGGTSFDRNILPEFPIIPIVRPTRSNHIMSNRIG
jgi:hypothetical protein